MLSMMQAIDRLVVRAALGAAMILLALMSCVAFYQVITRFVLESPSIWSEVAARSLMIWMVYLGLVAVFRSGSLISIDLVLDAVPERVREAMAVVIAGLTLAVLGVMIWYGWAMVDRTGSQGLAGLTNPITGGIISIGLVYAAIPIGAALSAIAVVARLAEELGRQGPPPEPIIVQDI